MAKRAMRRSPHERAQPMARLMDDEDATLAALRRPRADMTRWQLSREALQNIPKAMRKKILEQPEVPWTPELVVTRLHSDTSPKTLEVLGLLGIDDEELHKLARKALSKADRTRDEDATDAPAQVLRQQLAEERARLSGIRHYMPPGASELSCGRALLQVALEHNKGAADIYYRQLVPAWGLPGCRTAIAELVDCRDSLSEWLPGFVSAIVSRVGATAAKKPASLIEAMIEAEPKHSKALGPVLAPPHDAEAVRTRRSEDPDVQILVSLIYEVIRIGFNRPVDLANDAPKVVAHRAPYLISAIILRSLNEWAIEDTRSRRLEDEANRMASAGDAYRTVVAGDEGRAYDVDRIMRTDPTARAERNLKKALRDAFRKLKAKLHHFSKYLQDAEEWYRARVNPGTIEQYVSDLAQVLDQLGYSEEDCYRDRGDVENAIALCDEVAGWPRRWKGKRSLT